jgi:hypothetical protein
MTREEDEGSESYSEPNPDDWFEFKIIREQRGVFGRYIYKCLGGRSQVLLIATTLSSWFTFTYQIVDGISHVLLGTVSPGSKSASFDVSGIRTNFTVKYSKNRMGRKDLRRFKIHFSDGRTYGSKSLRDVSESAWQDLQETSVRSIKNFICIDRQCSNREVCLMTRCRNGKFLMRVREPMKLVEAFCLVVTACHRGVP